ncbi:MAG: hypothetical protein U5K74_06640 [Gemmatimonadaceae bacterium]|nr:hypothetical protein [Gemmatimonadaceae bacterium]
MLLPRHGETETWEDPRAELVRRLLEYQQMREVVDILERRGDERRSRFARAFLPESGESRPPRRSRSRSASCWSRWTACCASTKEPTMHEVVARALDVDGRDARRCVGDRRCARNARWRELVGARRRALGGPVGVFSALLELAKLRRAPPDPTPTVCRRGDPP